MELNKFKTFYEDDYDKDLKFTYNKNLLKMYLHKIMFSNPKNSLKSLFDDEEILLIINEYIFELLGADLIKYYEAGTKKTKRCLYDDKPDGATKLENRKYIQMMIENSLLMDYNCLDDFSDDLIYFYFQKKNNKKPEIDDLIEKCDDKIIGKIDDNRYYSNVWYGDMDYYNILEDKLLSSKEKANKYEDEKNTDEQIKYMKKYNKYQKKLVEWTKKHPIKWYDEEKEKQHIIKMKTF